MTTTTATASFRKTKAGEWVAFAPLSALAAGGNVTIVKKSGESTVRRVERVGRGFEVAGVTMAYGYLAAETVTASADHAAADFGWAATGMKTRRASRYTRRACITGGNCSSFGNSQSCGGHDCDGF